MIVQIGKWFRNLFSSPGPSHRQDMADNIIQMLAGREAIKLEQHQA